MRVLTAVDEQRRTSRVARSARALAVIAAGLAAAAGPARAYQTAPSSAGNADYSSVIKAIDPHTPGLSGRVLGHDNLVRLDNRSARPVVVYGYAGDQYARLLPGGTVQLNLRSPAFYLNEYRFGDQRVPPYADASATPDWRTMDHSGELIWHDHRIHAAKSASAPRSAGGGPVPVHAYRIPLRVGSRPGAIVGRLYWVGGSHGSHLELFVLPITALISVLLLLDIARRKRVGERRLA